MSDFLRADRRIDALSDEQKLFYLWRLSAWYADKLKGDLSEEKDIRAAYLMAEHRTACRQIHDIIGDVLF